MIKLRLILTLCFLSLFSSLSAGEVFRFKYNKGDKYRFISSVNQMIYVNDVYSHQATIQNRIGIEVLNNDQEAGFLQGSFYMLEQQDHYSRVYSVSREYVSRFWRDYYGTYSLDEEYYMPVVRNVPVFPERELNKGDVWVHQGYEVHDLRQGFGISEPFRYPFLVNYEYKGKTEFEGQMVDLISVQYTVFHKPQPIFSRVGVFPTRISGYSEQDIYWDNANGRPLYYREDYDFIWEWSDGQVLEFRGNAESRMIEAVLMEKERIVQDIQDMIDNEGLEDTDVGFTDDGIIITLSNIQFGADSAMLAEIELEKLLQVGAILAEYPDRDILITGHTALAGSEAGRQNLSLARAKAVADYLLQLGVKAPEEILIQGRGAEVPVGDNDTEEGRRKNRRVEIMILEN